MAISMQPNVPATCQPRSGPRSSPGGTGGSNREMGGNGPSFWEAWPSAASQPKGGSGELSPGEGGWVQICLVTPGCHMGPSGDSMSLSVKYALYFLAEISAIASGILSWGLRYYRSLCQCQSRRLHNPTYGSGAGDSEQAMCDKGKG